MIVKEAMNKKVITSGPEITLKDASRIMADNCIGSIVITKNEDVVGILTERDILYAFANSNFDALAKDVMTTYVIYIDAQSSVEKATRLMIENKIKKLPVIDNERLVGIITASDIIAKQPEIVRKLKKLIAK